MTQRTNSGTEEEEEDDSEGSRGVWVGSRVSWSIIYMSRLNYWDFYLTSFLTLAIFFHERPISIPFLFTNCSIVAAPLRTLLGVSFGKSECFAYLCSQVESWNHFALCHASPLHHRFLQPERAQHYQPRPSMHSPFHSFTALDNSIGYCGPSLRQVP